MVDLLVAPGLAVEMRDTAGQPTASVRLRRHPSELPELFGKYLARIGSKAGRLGAHFSGPPFLLYHGIVDDELDVEIGMPVAVSAPGLDPIATCPEGVVGASELPCGRTAVYVYRGPYSDLGNAWADLNTWLMRHGFSPTETCWESYVDNPDVVPPEELRTELFQLLD